MEHEQIFPQAGWVEHNPTEIWDNTREVIGSALSKANLTRHDIAAVGITNQRETAVVWDKTTGEPVYNAIVWQDTRTQPIVDELAADGGAERFKQKVGLPLATYFSGTKIKWILDNVEGARAKAEAGDLIFGNTDSWVLWNLTGGDRRRRARHRRHQRLADHVHGPRHAVLGRRDPGDLRRAALHDARHQVLLRGLRHGAHLAAAARGTRSRASWATSRPPPSARPRSRPAKPRTPTAPAAS